MTNRNPLPYLSLALVAALAAACGQETPQAPDRGPTTLRQALSAAGTTVTPSQKDSGLAQAGTAGLRAAPEVSGTMSLGELVEPVPVRAGDEAVVTVIGASTSRGEEVAVRGAIEASLFPCVGGCGTSDSDNVGATATVGPAPGDGNLGFILPLGLAGTGVVRVEGSRPSFTVRMDDGIIDFDFDDVVLSVELREGVAGCDFFAGQVDDPLLAADQIQRAFFRLFEESAPEDGSRFERGGYIVERDGVLELVPAASNDDPRVCSSDFRSADVPADATLRAHVHTHPRAPGEAVPDVTSCPNGELHFGDGLGVPDIESARRSEVPLYVVDADEVHRAPAHFLDPELGTGASLEVFARNPDADCSAGDDDA